MQTYTSLVVFNAENDAEAGQMHDNIVAAALDPDNVPDLEAVFSGDAITHGDLSDDTVVQFHTTNILDAAEGRTVTDIVDFVPPANSD